MSYFVTVPQDAVRLVGGEEEYEGRVEIFHDNEWGTVCDDGWDLDDANVVCRQLGYPAAVGAFLFATFGQGTGPIWLDEVQCIGTEANLTECSHDGFGNEDCIHFEDAGVRCATEGGYISDTSCTTMTFLFFELNGPDEADLIYCVLSRVSRQWQLLYINYFYFIVLCMLMKHTVETSI